MNRFTLSALLILTVYGSSVSAEETLYKADFSRGKRPEIWGVNTGYWEVEEGYLVGRELKAEKHSAASRWRIPMQDGVIECRLRFAGATHVHIGFDPAKGELKKKGHLYSLIITPSGSMIKEHRNKADETSKDKILATAKDSLPKNEWFTVRLETKGNSVNVDVGERMKLAASKSDFSVKKPTVVFRVLGGDMHIDDVHVIVNK